MLASANAAAVSSERTVASVEVTPARPSSTTKLASRTPKPPIETGAAERISTAGTTTAKTANETSSEIVRARSHTASRTSAWNASPRMNVGTTTDDLAHARTVAVDSRAAPPIRPSTRDALRAPLARSAATAPRMTSPTVASARKPTSDAGTDEWSVA